MSTSIHFRIAGVLLATLTAALGQPAIDIRLQPQNQTNLAGTTATFTVGAIGTPPLSYQWQKLGVYWGDLSGCTESTLCLTNVQTSHAGDYRVVITNLLGAATSAVAQLTVLLPPRINPSAALQHEAVDLGSNVSFTVSASGTPPLSCQWLLDGLNLPGRTNNTLAITNAQPADEGDYTVQVSNSVGVVTSEPARLWVVPHASAFVKENFTNNLGRLPYFYLLPTNYNAAKTYPLFLDFHGTPGDETMITTPNYGYPGYANLPKLKAAVSFRMQERDPMLLLWPTRRAGDASWTDSYLRQVSALLDEFIPRFNVDTNRVLVWGGSEGVHAAWDIIAMRPGFFAAAGLAAGWKGNALLEPIKDVPIWAWCASDDSLVADTRAWVHPLRRAGANLIYTEYRTGGHLGGIGLGCATPVIIDWFRGQRRGIPSILDPILTISTPTTQPILFTGATNLTLAGSAAAFDCPVNQVSWTNFANFARGVASGTNFWSVNNLPLTPNRTNLIFVIATTTSWAPAFGGTTTFNDTLNVIQTPLRSTLVWQGSNAVLNWTGAAPPYHIQTTASLAPPDWTPFASNATPPLNITPDAASRFYRILGQ